MSYYLQALLLATIAAFVFRPQRKTKLLPVLIAIFWFIGVSFIFWRYGSFGQLSFYQNDQRFHWTIVHHVLSTDFGFTFNKLNSLRAPYTLPAFALSNIGFDPTLSLKFVSLCCTLGNFMLIDHFLSLRRYKFLVFYFWILAGPISVFFSLLALRETMMLLCVTQIFIGSSHGGRITSLLVLLVLRPHLAAAIVFGLVWGWIFGRLQLKWHLLTALTTAILPVYLGTIAFLVGGLLVSGTPMELEHGLLLRDEIIQVFSAFAGLQFLTVAYQTVEFSNTSLLIIRLIFPEIVLIPLFFVVCSILPSQTFSRLKLSVLATFVFFTSISSGTEFLSVRQSLPMMSIMGLAVILTFFQPATNQENLRNVKHLTGV